MRLSIVFLVAFAAIALNGTISRRAVSAGPEDKSTAWPEPQSIDPRGRPDGQIAGKPARYYVFRVGDKWHLITTSRSRKARTATSSFKRISTTIWLSRSQPPASGSPAATLRA